MIYHWVHTADPVGFIMISPVIWSRDLLCLASGFGCVPGTLVLRGVDIITYEKQSLFTPLFRDVLWTHVASDLQQWPFGERHCNQDNGPDHSTACQLRLGFARTTGCDVCVMVSKAQESIHAPALLWIPIPRVYACVCVLVCVSVIPSQQWRFTVLDGGMMITLLSFPRKRSNFQQTSTAFEENLRSLMIPKELSAIRW